MCVLRVNYLASKSAGINSLIDNSGITLLLKTLVAKHWQDDLIWVLF